MGELFMLIGRYLQYNVQLLQLDEVSALEKDHWRRHQDASVSLLRVLCLSS